MIRAKKYKSRKIPKVDLFRKRGTDYSDFAYREAVTKLKYLLAESYTPITVHKFSTSPTPSKSYSLANPYEDSPLTEPTYVSPFKLNSLTPPKRPDISFDVAPEYSSYLRKQEDYIQQLEKEGRTCREELARMLAKVRHVISENDRLKNESKPNGSEETEEESEIEEKEKRVRCKHTCSAPNIVYESRISELEAQLTQMRLELRKAQDEAFFLKTKVYDAGTPDSNKQIEALQRERDELNATVSNLQMLVTQLRDKEASATLKVKRSLDVVDQAHFDKNQLEMEIRRLKSDLERMNDKQREIMQESARRVSEAERRYTLQIERLNGDLAAQWDTANRMNLELDRAKRMESELRREIAQKSTVIDELKKELSMKTSNLQTEALTAGAEKESLESELSAQKLAVERAERAGRQEASRLQAEVTSLRQRLDRADSDLLHSRKENLRLSENIGTLEKELELARLAKDPSSKDPKRPDELTNMIKEMDSKHAQSVAELEGMIQSQTQLMEKLKSEYQNVTQRLEDANAKHKLDRIKLVAENEALLQRLRQIWEEMASLQNNVDYLNSKLDAPNYENQGWQGGGEYQNEGGGSGGGDGSGQGAQDQLKREQLEQGPDKYLGDKTQLTPETGQYEVEGATKEESPVTVERTSKVTAERPSTEPKTFEENKGSNDPEQYQGDQGQYQGDQSQYQGDPGQYEGDPNAYQQDYNPSQYPEGYDPNQYPEGYDPNQYPEGYDPNQYPEGYDPSQYPEGYDPNQYPDGYDPNQYPEGYDPNQYQGEYTEGYQEGTPQAAQPTDVQPPSQQVVTGVDSTGSSIVAKKEEFIPDTGK